MFEDLTDWGLGYKGGPNLGKKTGDDSMRCPIMGRELMVNCDMSPAFVLFRSSIPRVCSSIGILLYLLNQPNVLWALEGKVLILVQ